MSFSLEITKTDRPSRTIKMSCTIDTLLKGAQAGQFESTCGVTDEAAAPITDLTFGEFPTTGMMFPGELDGMMAIMFHWDL